MLRERVGVLERSDWPEVGQRWSRLTPSGFPVELTVAGDVDTAAPLRWTCEVAGPEVADTQRLGLVNARMAAAGQAIPAALLGALSDQQRGNELRYGAWLGGREAAAGDSGSVRFKLYAEMPLGAALDGLPLPTALSGLMPHTPAGTRASMLGIEPARKRIEIYLRLPAMPIADLEPLLRSAGHPQALQVLDRGLPGGVQRLSGRKLGVSFAVADAGSSIEVALFVSARTMFPGEPEALALMVPLLTQVSAGLGRTTMVSLGLGGEPGRELTPAVGVTLVRQR